MPVAVRDDPPDFDVHQASTVYFFLMVANPCYNSLVTWDNVDHNKMVPDLAKKWELSPDGLTYTFYLSKGVKFHDGGDFNAKAVKATFDRIVGIGLQTAGMISLYKETEIVDDYTAKIRLTAPDPAFPMKLPKLYIFSPAAVHPPAGKACLQTGDARIPFRVNSTANNPRSAQCPIACGESLGRKGTLEQHRCHPAGRAQAGRYAETRRASCGAAVLESAKPFAGRRSEIAAAASSSTPALPKANQWLP